MFQLKADWCKDWQDPFNTLASIQGQIFRAVKQRKTFRFEIEGKGYFAKLHWGIGWQEIFKDLIQGRLPIISARNEWRAIQRCEELNISTMKLVAYGCQGWNPAGLKSFVVTEELTPTISLEDLCKPWPNSPPSFIFKRQLIHTIATIARTLHNNGFNHRDFYLCHFLLDLSTKSDLTQPPKIYLIDLHRVQLRRKTPLRWRIKDISGLFFSALNIDLTQNDLFYFMKIYADKPLRQIFSQDNRFWQKVIKRAQALYFKTFNKQPDLKIDFYSKK